MDHTHHHVAATNKRITGANTTHANPTKKPGLFRCITLYTLFVFCFVFWKWRSASLSSLTLLLVALLFL